MRAEDVGARTWLYAGLAGWALCVWILALFGMGGSIDRLDDDPSLRQALPEPAAPGAQRLGPMAQYGDVAARPLFTDNRRPQPFVIDPMGEAEGAGNAFDYVLTSVLRTPEVQLVILQPTGGGEPVRVRQGNAPDGAAGWVLQSVEARRAVFAGPEGEQALELRVFDGVGGQAPTPSNPPDAMATGTVPEASPAVMADSGMASPQQAPGGPQAPQREGQRPAGPMDGNAADGPAQQQAAQDQVEMIRQRIEERRARLRADEMATQRPRANPTNK